MSRSKRTQTRLWRRLPFWMPYLAVVALIGLALAAPAWAFINDLCSRDDMVVAAGHGDTAALRRLIALGADPSVVGREEHLTPLGAASAEGQIAAVRLLLGRGADPNRRDDHGTTPLAYALRVKRPGIAALLRQAGGHE